MHHAASEDLDPAALFTYITSRAAADQAADIHLGTGFGKWKIRRTETDFHRLAKHFLYEKIKGLLQIGERNVFVHIQSFTLVEKTMRPRADGFIAVYATGTDDPDRRLLRFHHPGLHAAGMGAQEPVRIPMYIKCILHIPRGMVFRQVERREIMPVVFDLRPLRY